MKSTLKSITVGLVASTLFAGAVSAETIIIGHFGNPTPMQLLASSDAVEKATGWEVEWRTFDSGTDVIAPPGAVTSTPRAPSAAGPTLLQVKVVPRWTSSAPLTVRAASANAAAAAVSSWLSFASPAPLLHSWRGSE